MGTSASSACFQVDAFTDRPFSGNPAAVCLRARTSGSPSGCNRWRPEMNLSETAFVHRLERDGDLRPCAGSRRRPKSISVVMRHWRGAHVVWEEAIYPHTQARAPVSHAVRPVARAHGGWRHGIEIGTSRPRPEVAARAATGISLEALAVELQNMLAEMRPTTSSSSRPNRLVREAYSRTSAVWRVCRCGASRSRQPHRPAAAPSRYDFVSRFFAPAVGVDEDPVTGSAHCCLGPFWQRRLGRDRLRGFQASLRGGYVGLWVRSGRVLLSGEAVTVFRAELLC